MPSNCPRVSMARYLVWLNIYTLSSALSRLRPPETLFGSFSPLFLNADSTSSFAGRDFRGPRGSAARSLQRCLKEMLMVVDKSFELSIGLLTLTRIKREGLRLSELFLRHTIYLHCSISYVSNRESDRRTRSQWHKD
ncbi:uncharacterized protein K460DRAFT_163673 [Cucurbitaria berberidis CBS 394.84]|uniref:Uncharacterized protein n=1 Tax=Cucurbitaria berberidis CBS 394.84 TaxID=1168544 RepID=A0A9P4L7R7_9PLEO|nr:uncharacterized protein K460DRAFT_163673 [Cucurbitaria berberidis CBS 394.84]KAF1844403.1 hypothetical protein K460DRAFT_163673 [Cucurbitaria berberidis CBS 394.84]